MMRRFLPYVVVAAALLVLPAFVSNYYVDLAAKVLIFAIFAMSLNLVLGHAGLFTLGHAAYFGLGAYTAGIIGAHYGGSIWIGLPAGVLVAMGAAAVLAPLALRARGSYFLMITLALGQVFWGIAVGWRSVTGGDDGLSNVPRPQMPVPWPLIETASYYYSVVVLTALAAAALILILSSPFGCALRGIRESEVRMAVLGYNVQRYRFFALAIGGAFAGFAGVLYAYLNGYVGPDFLDVTRSADVLLMVIAGGVGSYWGPALGAALLILLQSSIGAYTNHWVGILGAIYIAVTILAPKGLVGMLPRRLAGRGRA
jgi:branched-chain amino acid transport system permease protein